MGIDTRSEQIPADTSPRGGGGGGGGGGRGEQYPACQPFDFVRSTHRARPIINRIMGSFPVRPGALRGRGGADSIASVVRAILVLVLSLPADAAAPVTTM